VTRPSGRFVDRPTADDEASRPDGADASPPPPPAPVLASLPGRLVVLTGPLLLLLVIVRQFLTLPEPVELFRKVVAGGFVLGAAWLVVLIVVRHREQFLWRVRGKLILSYVFLGFVPVVLLLTFALAAGFVVYTNLAGYLFHQGFQEVVDDLVLIAESSVADVPDDAGRLQAALDRAVAGVAGRYPSISLVALPLDAGATPGLVADAAPAVAGAWRHQPPVTTMPSWLMVRRQFRGALVPRADSGEEPQLVARAAVTAGGGRYLVIADVPIDTDLVLRLHGRTGTRVRGLSLDGAASRVEWGFGDPIDATGAFRQTVAFMDYLDWDTGRSARASVELEASPAGLYDHVTDMQPPEFSLILVLLVLGALFLIIQGSALVHGVVLARSITSAVHELAVGTERVRSGDFAHRISIEYRDQLGDLAESFNRMSGSIEHLLHVQREKQRLDDELRIAREIQQSLLPVELPDIDGLSIADVCEPAREVGGDYYDFFELGPRQLGVLIADVAGKGTSAALYMAELKGLMIALSHTTRSPRELLIRVNRLLANHLDNRSFITMTYVVIDLDRRTLTMARAGHTPLLVVSGGQSEVIAPEGMVLGLRLPGALERFEEVLAEHTRPLHTGDIVVLYTDGVTEAMDRTGELFGDGALARVVVGQRDRDAAGIRERVLRDVRAFVGDAEPHDDMTMIILKVTDGGAERRST